MTKQTFHRQLMFDPTVPGCFRPLTRQEIQKQRLPKPEPVDVFRDNAEEKLWKIAGLQDADGYLGLALDAIRYFSSVIKTMTIRLSREIFIDIVTLIRLRMDKWEVERTELVEKKDTQRYHSSLTYIRIYTLQCKKCGMLKCVKCNIK